MSSGKILLGVLGGVAAGALIGILFAPDKGSATRQKIMKRGEDYADAVKDTFNQFVDNVSGKYEKVKETVSEFADKGKQKTQEAKANVSSSMS